ncbi:MAG: simple sugar transport system permease protein [Clostridiales bacterium]|jgi:simple sugar transport system permease protein|nr:simple sugar transport system permease protein [Clostridiales bacterium]
MEKLALKAKKTVAMDFITKWGTLLTIAIMVAAFSFTMPTFMTLPNMITIIRAVCIVTVIATGMTISTTVNGLDLSVGSTATFANTVLMTFFVWYSMGTTVLGTVLSILMTIVICLVIAVINSILIVKLKIPDMLATLSTMFMFEGVAMTYAGGGAINENMMRPDGSTALGKVPKMFRTLGKEPWIIIVMLVLVFVVFLFLSYTKHGRYMYSVGGNPEAARLSGINVKKYRALAYFMSTVLASIGGMLIGARVGNAQINSGTPYLMGAVAAAHIGMSVAGAGKPNALGTLAGAILIGVLENGLIMASVPYFAVNIFKGAVLAIALALNYARKKT